MGDLTSDLLFAGIALFAVAILVLSMAEAALLSANRQVIRRTALAGDRRALRLEKLIASGDYLSAIIVAVNAAVIGLSTLATILTGHRMAEGSEWSKELLHLLTIAAIVVFAELAPKTYGSIHADRLVLRLSSSITALTQVLRWPVRLVTGVAVAMLSLFRVPPMHRQRFVTEADIQAAATLGEEAGLVEPEEGVMLDHVIEMGEQTAREIMVPRVQIEAIDTEASLDEALEKAHESGFSRLPVFREDLDNIVGIAHVKDLLAALINGRDWHEYLREAWVVAEATPVPGIFDTMRTERSHMAVVADEYGGTAGIVTIEDVLEEVVGELRDEHERPEEDFVPLGPNEWMGSGRFRLDELYERIGLEMPEDEEADTIAGLLAEITGRIPAAGEEIEHEGLRYLVEESDGQYLAKVRVTASARPKTGGEQ